MSDALDLSVTLEEVFSVVQNKRVPLAPELAGYLALEIAEGADAQGGNVDPKAVYIAEEGTVALVRPKRASATGSADGSIRTILARLLESSGSQTPALTAASRRKPTGNMRALTEELEAALIPVNRAAGRRALARLAREVKRVTLGVGRNASAPPARGVSPSQPGGRAPDSHGRPAPSSLAPDAASQASADRGIHLSDEPPTARREVAPEVLKSATPGLIEPREVELSLTDLESVDDVSGTRAPIKSSADVDSLLEQFEVSSKRGDHAVARDLKAMVGMDLTPPPPHDTRVDSARGPSPSKMDASVEALLAISEPVASVPSAPRVEPARQSARNPRPSFPETLAGLSPSGHPPANASYPPAAAPPSRKARDLPTAPAARASRGRISTGGEFVRPGKRRGESVMIVLALGIVVALGVGVMMFKLPAGFLTGRTAEKVAQEKASAEAAHEKAAAAQLAAACRATLEVDNVPPNAEVLLREGQAPADIDRMPVGARLEFVATAEGYAPRRTVVPAGAAWDPGTDGKPRFEVAVQLEKSVKPKGDVWPAGEPGSEVGGKGPPGTVHIVSAPRGAEIWLLAGIGPDAHVEQLPCDIDVDVLVAGPTTLRKRLHVPAASFVPDSSATSGMPSRIAKVNAK